MKKKTDTSFPLIAFLILSQQTLKKNKKKERPLYTNTFSSFHSAMNCFTAPSMIEPRTLTWMGKIQLATCFK